MANGRRNVISWSNPREQARKSLEQRFWEKVVYDDDSGCWLWVGALTGNASGKGGYGSLAIPKASAMRAHVFSWKLHYGEVPDGLNVLHLCDVRRCVRPAHLYVGTLADNRRDLTERGPLASNLRIRPWVADRFRAEWAAGTWALRKDAAAAYDISLAAVSLILDGKRHASRAA